MASPAHWKNLRAWDLVLDFAFAEAAASVPCGAERRELGPAPFHKMPELSSPACPPEQLCVTSPAVLAVTQLISFCAVPFFTKCFYVKYEKDGNVQSGEKYTSVQCFSWNIYYLLPSSHQSQQPADRLFWPFSKSPSKQPQVLLALCNQITYNLMNFFSEKQSPPTGFTAIWCQMPLKWNDVLWTPTWVLFAACLCLKSVVISHLQPLPPGILHPTGACSPELLRLCSIFPGTRLETASSRSVPLPSTALLPCGIGCRAPLGSASVWELFDCAVSWQPRGMSLTRAPGQAEASSSLLVSCSVSRISVT